VVNGCTDATAFNYNASANTDDGSCIAVVNGCTDATAFNYNASANTDDGSCIAVVNGCTDATAFNYNASANTDDGSCIAVVSGCIDPLACNFDPLVNTDNGSCIYATIEVCNGVDDNCDGEIDEFVTNSYYADLDGDGFGDLNNNLYACTVPAGYVDNGEDCDDTQILFDDMDADGYGAGAPVACGSTLSNNDCDDNNALINLTAAEICGNGIDEDCSGADELCPVPGCTDPLAYNFNPLATTDDGSCIAVVTGCTDATAFNYNAAANTDDGTCIPVLNGCTEPSAFNYNPAANTDDGSCIAVVTGCTDATAFNYNAAANTDDGSCIAVVLGCTDVTAFNYNPSANTDDGTCIPVILGCLDLLACNYDATANTDNLNCTYPIAGYDCNGVCLQDTDADGVCDQFEISGCTDVAACNYDAIATDDDGSCILPQTEICNQLDDNCNGLMDEGFDVDGDSFTSCDGDCDDNNANINPAQSELCNTIDDNCDGNIDEGFDIDGDGFTSCNGDCNDNDSAINPSALESCNGTDDNCDGNSDEGFDADADGFTSCNGDCNDNDANVNPSATETCNGLDDNCDGNSDEGVTNTYFADGDEDGFGDLNSTIQGCTAPNGYVDDNTDCNDADSLIYPGAMEICNQLDDNCDGTVDEGVTTIYYLDADGDGYGNATDSVFTCIQTTGYSANNDDCDDNNANTYPGVSETDDNLDNDCDGDIDEGFEFIPDAFSPNMDGSFDQWEITQMVNNEVVNVKVYNRWGGLVYQMEGYQNNWTGIGNTGPGSGNELVAGTYFYIVEFTVAQKEVSGYVTIWR
jgi:gliding motility-associated-like protein